MPGNYNRIILVGNLTRDPEEQSYASGATKVKFGIAVNRRSKEKDETMFVDVGAWERTGEICMQYLRKGMSVLIDGRLSIRSYEDKDGTKKKAVEVIAEAIQMLDKKGETSAPAAYAQHSLEEEEPELAF